MSRVEEALRRAGGGVLVDLAGSAAWLGARVEPSSEAATGGLAVDDYPCEAPVAANRQAGGPDAARELPRAAIAAPRTGTTRTGTTRTLGRLGEEVEGKIVVDHETSPRLNRAVPAPGRDAARDAGAERPQDDHGLERAAARRQDADLDQPRADAERIVQAARAARSTPTCAGRRSTSCFGCRTRAGSPTACAAKRRQLPLIEVTSRLTVLPAGTPDRSPMAGADVRPDGRRSSRKPPDDSTGCSSTRRRSA